MPTLPTILLAIYLAFPTVSGFVTTTVASPRVSLLQARTRTAFDIDTENPNLEDVTVSRRNWLSSTMITAAAACTTAALSPPTNAVVAPSSPKKRCTDIESCRELGDEKIAQDLKENPVTRLPSGTRYKIIKPGVGAETVQEGSSIDLIFSLSRAGGQYMYSQGFGYELVEEMGTLVKDSEGLDNLRVMVGSHQQVPIGIEQSLLGMKRGERRRVELTPNVGLATSNWEPAPKTAAGKQSVRAYQRVLDGFGSQPPFPAPTIWDIEVTRIRN
ncbi:expressed unknown protein [Seminavis robusta]|uniref:peptidylprolyl isomerase n=1 Tax=Seminavis robusta TaxID=568900 RepID=A0A9N8DPQ3_9STRA|nr:expressed unknown protein [Seminavis robusta]|eukprot:Sro282_g107480.1 n/a (272) ;mRNA; f:35131-35946